MMRVSFPFAIQAAAGRTSSRHSKLSLSVLYSGPQCDQGLERRGFAVSRRIRPWPRSHQEFPKAHLPEFDRMQVRRSCIKR